MNITTVLLLLVSIVCLFLAAYAFFQYKIKKEGQVTLTEKVEQLKDNVAKAEGKLQQISLEYDAKESALQHLLELEEQESQLRESIDQLNDSNDKLSQEIGLKTQTTERLTQDIKDIKKEISLYTPVQDYIDVGFFEEPEYLFETSERFKAEIKIIRDQQKEMIADKSAVNIPDQIAAVSNNSLAKKILQGQARLMLKSFNIECDALMAKVKPSNFANTLDRINKLAEEIEKTAASLSCGFSKEYVRLKFNECELQYQFKLKDQYEKEEQKAIKEQMREEQKAIREYERMIAKAQKEEEMYRSALDVARKELELAGDQERQMLEDKIALLQQQLEEASENEKRAKSMAEQTRRGHVYIISNIGSFGENVYKIGLTRRLEPLDRVKELGDASVPFSFDVHALIYSDDAPSLESHLHREFNKHRVNAVNLRKEFFAVDLEAIRQKAKEIVGDSVEFKMTALAEEYYESHKLRKQLQASGKDTILIH